jgi:hypothetical protein
MRSSERYFGRVQPLDDGENGSASPMDLHGGATTSFLLTNQTGNKRRVLTPLPLQVGGVGVFGD